MWVGSLNQLEGTKGYWAKVNSGVSFSFNEPTADNEIMSVTPSCFKHSILAL